jgi:hypothetical protein
MKTFKIFSTAALALMMAACSSEDAALNNSPAQQQGRKVHFTATIAAPGGNAGTRTEYTEVTEGDAAGTINVAWKAKDEIALIHNGTKDVVTVETVNEDGSATITGDITVGTNDKAVTAYYPAAAIELNSDKKPVPAEAYSANLLAQDGTLSYIASNLDLRSGESTIAVDGDKATLSDNVKLSSQTAIWKLTLQDNAETPAALSATQVSVIKDGETPETLAGTSTLSTATSTVYLAMPPMSESEATVAIKAATADGTYIYENSGLTLKAGNYYQSTVTMAPAVTYLSELKEDYIAQDGEVLKGKLAGNYKISIAKGATVTLDEVTINGENDYEYAWAGITCEGDATIILKDGSTNTVKGFDANYPGIYVPSGNTLTIKGETKGTGSLNASSNGSGAGIGGGNINCGNIEIQGGKITATGGSGAAGIGSGSYKSCGTITISGGTVTATGGSDAAGIGTGYTENSYCGDITISGGTVTATGGENGAGIGTGKSGSCNNITISGGTVSATGGEKAAGIGSGINWADCGNITITTGVTQVTATKGNEAPNSIGAGYKAICGTVTIGGVETGFITQSPYKYPLPALSLTNPAVGQVIGDDGKNYDYASLPGGVTAVAKICYVSGSNGLALALADEGQMNWSTAISTCAAHTPAFTGGTWKLATKDEWNNMITAAGSYTALRDGFTSVGGTNMQSDNYWSSTEYGSGLAAYYFKFGSGDREDVESKDNGYYVRSALAF